MKCIVIDDEHLALKVIKDYVDKVPYLSLEGVFDNPFEALQYLSQQPVDIVFVDINMPGLNGLDLIRSLRKTSNIVFTTAYSEYAIDGFELDATDYLLKPFSFERFLRALNKCSPLEIPRHTMPSGDRRQDFIFVNSEHRMIKVMISEIYYIEGFKEYVKIYTPEDQPILTIKSLKSLEGQLEQSSFIRIHKSYIIAIDKIQDIRNGKVKVSDKYLPIGDTYKEIFNEIVLKGRI